MTVLKSIPGLFLLLSISTAWAHGTENHDASSDGVEVVVTEAKQVLPIQVDANFELIDHHRNLVTNQSYQGKHMLVFFGYANCKVMCSFTLTRIGNALNIVGDSLDKLRPLVITVDPERDTPEVMKTELIKYHPNIIGLTGNETQLARVYKGFNQSPKSKGLDWEGDPLISHTSYIYMLDKNGNLETFFPPILNPQSMAKIILKYLDKA